MKPKTSSLKLYVKPDVNKFFGDLEFIWLTDQEIKSYQKQGYKRAKKSKGGKHYARCPH